MVIIERSKFNIALSERLLKFLKDRTEFIINPQNWFLYGKSEFFTCYALDLPFYGKRIYLNFDRNGQGRFQGSFVEHLELEEISSNHETQYLFHLDEFKGKKDELN